MATSAIFGERLLLQAPFQVHRTDGSVYQVQKGGGVKQIKPPTPLWPWAWQPVT